MKGVIHYEGVLVISVGFQYDRFPNQYYSHLDII